MTIRKMLTIVLVLFLAACTLQSAPITTSTPVTGTESDVADLLRTSQDEHPGVAIGSYPFIRDGLYGSNFVIRSPEGAPANRCCQVLIERLKEAGYEPVEGGI